MVAFDREKYFLGHNAYNVVPIYNNTRGAVAPPQAFRVFIF